MSGNRKVWAMIATALAAGALFALSYWTGYPAGGKEPGAGNPAAAPEVAHSVGFDPVTETGLTMGTGETATGGADPRDEVGHEGAEDGLQIISGRQWVIVVQRHLDSMNWLPG